MHHRQENICHGHCHGRMFPTREEKIKHLTEYKKWLDNESKGVTEAIEDLKAKQTDKQES